MKNIDAYIQYLLKEKRYSLHTVVSYAKDVKSFHEFLGNQIPDEQIDQRHVRQWIMHLSKQGLNHKSINRKISSLKSYYKFLYITQTLSTFPLEGIRNLKVEKKIQIPFSESEMQSVARDHFPDNFDGFTQYLIIVLFYNLGLRKSELIELQLSDYQRDNFRIKGKGNKERLVPVSDNLQKLLEEYLEQREKIVTHKTATYFFIKKGQKLNQTFVYRLINNYFRRVTSKEKRSPHILRHSFATHLVQNGAEINAVKELMGHASLSSTQIYVNNNIEELKKIYQTAHPRNLREDKSNY